MAGIPLPALDIRPPAPPPNQLEQLGQLLGLRNAIQEQPLRMQALQNQAQAGQMENQQRQIQLNDQEAMTAAMHQWDGKDINSLVPLVVKNGGSAQAVMGLKAKALDIQKTLSGIASQDATTGSTKLKTLQTRNDLINGALNAVSQLPDDQIASGLVSSAQQLGQQGLLDQQHVQSALQLAQSGDPNAIRAQLSLMQKQSMSLSQQMDAAQKQAQTNLATTQNEVAKQSLGFGPSGPAADSKYRFLEAKVLAKQPISDADKNWMEAYKKQKLLVPVIAGQVREAGYASSRLYPVFDNATKETMYVSANDLNAMRAENPSRYSPASYSPESIGQRDTTAYFTKGKGGQQLTAYNTALAHLDTLQSLASALHNGDVQAVNRVAQRFKQETGNPAPTNFEAAKNAMAGEVASALKASGATDQEIEKVDQTFSRAQSPAQLDGAINTYRSLLNSKAHQLQGQYAAGMQGKPNFNAAPSPQNPGGTVKLQAPDGTIKEVPAADAQHYIGLGAKEVK